MHPRTLALAAAALLAVLQAAPAAAADPPFETESAALRPAGAVEVDLGGELAAGSARPLFPEEDGTAAVLRGGVRTGLGSWGEVRALGDLIRRYHPDDGPTVSGAGDWWVGTKVRLGPADRLVSWAAEIEVKLPVAGDQEGLGTDLADVAVQALAGGGHGRHRWDANAGLAIVGAPFRERSQVDLLTYAARYEIDLDDRWKLGGEVAGREGGDFTPARSAVRVGVRAAWRRWELNGSAAVGLAVGSPDLEIRLGARLRFDRGPRRVAAPPGQP